MAIKFRDLRKAATTAPPIEALTGGRIARADRVHSVHRQVDNILGNDRNVVARVGLHGAEAFQVTSVDPVSFVQEYPLRSVYRTVARVPPFTLLPGHFLIMSALVLPSGMTNQFNIINDWTPDGPYGEIALVITWGGPASDTTTHKIILPVSKETYAGEDTAPGAAWANLHRVEIKAMFPEKVTTAIADARTWSEGVTAEVAIKFRGGVRCVDLVLQQIPIVYARNPAADTTFSAALVTNGIGEPVSTYPVAYPVEERNATDPTYGATLLADIVHRQHTALGPVFMHWTAWDESAAVSATEIPSVSTSSTTFVDMLNTGIGGWKAANPGWSLSSGASAQQFKTSNSKREMRGNNACIPVRIWAYCSRTGTGDATLQFQSADYSAASITVDGAAGWRSSTGYLRCGAHQQDFSVLQVLGKTASGGDTLNLSSLLVEYADL